MGGATVESIGTEEERVLESAAESQATVLEDDDRRVGSSVGGAIFNFTNSILGAGAIALGGAIAKSGGLASVAVMICFGYLTNVSLDLLIEISKGSSFEELASQTYGSVGWSAVLISKLFYAFGGMVAYMVIIKDTCASALKHLLFGDHTNASILDNDSLVAVLLSVFVILPLCLLRDMTPLGSLSLLSILAMIFVMLTSVYLFVANPDHIRQDGGTFYEDWLEVRWGIFERYAHTCRGLWQL